VIYYSNHVKVDNWSIWEWTLDVYEFLVW
jgi:hypothetical protein